jgi:hypothetical protein
MPMNTSISQNVPLNELEYGILIDFLQDLHNGLIRKPDYFNNLHFLLFLLYDAHGCSRDRYPLWRWYNRIKKKLLVAKHLSIDNDNSRQHILTAIEHLIDIIPNVNTLIDEHVRLDPLYVHSTIHDLFQSYSPLHTYIYLEQHDKPIINGRLKIFLFFQQTIMKLYVGSSCDLIHFAIAHKKTSLLDEIFRDKVNWLDTSMNLATERGWLPLHYAAYVGDKDTVEFSSCLLISMKSLFVVFCC